MSTNTFYLYLPGFGLTNLIPTLKISLSPKISLIKPSNLLFCTGKVNSIHAIKRGVEVYLHSFLTSALDGGEWCGSCPAHVKARKSVPCTLHLEARWAPELLCTFLRAERYFAPAHILATMPPMLDILLMRNLFLQTPCVRSTVFVSHHYHPLLYNWKLAGLGAVRIHQPA